MPELTDKHPSNYITLAAAQFEEGNKQQAVKWYYVGQIRYRAYLKANPGLSPWDDPALFSSLTRTVGTPLNEYIGGDIDQWIQTIDEAIKWHNDHPDHFLDKESHRDIYAAVLADLEELKAHIDANRKEIILERAANGLENHRNLDPEAVKPVTIP